MAAIVAIVLLYGNFDPSATWWMPRCPSKIITGFDCPGCGTQRALHALLHGDLAGAVRYNFFLFPASTMAILLLIAQLGRNHSPRLARLHNILNSLPAILTVLITILLWWLLRNLLWPL